MRLKNIMIDVSAKLRTKSLLLPVKLYFFPTSARQRAIQKKKKLGAARLGSVSFSNVILNKYFKILVVVLRLVAKHLWESLTVVSWS